MLSVEGCQEFLTVNRACLKSGAKDHEQTSEENGKSTAKSIVNEWNEGERAYSAERVHRGHNSKSVPSWFTKNWRVMLASSLSLRFVTT